MQNILFITSTRLGDAVLTSGVLRWMMQQYPDAAVTIACGEVPAPLFAAVPRLRQIIPLKKLPRAGHWRALWRACVGTRWQCIVDMRGSGVAYGLYASKRLVFHGRRRGHKVVQYSEFIQADATPHIWLDTQAQASAAKRIPAHELVLAIGATANWIGKQWPVERFIALAQQLTAAQGMLPHAKIMLVAAPHEKEQLAAFYQAFPQQQIVSLVGYVDIAETAACLQRAALYVGNDSGLMHVSAAVGTPTFGLFGPSDENVYAPYGRKTAWLRTPQTLAELTGVPTYNPHTTVSLMTGLEIEPVRLAIQQFMQQSGGICRPACHS